MNVPVLSATMRTLAREMEKAGFIQVLLFVCCLVVCLLFVVCCLVVCLLFVVCCLFGSWFVCLFSLVFGGFRRLWMIHYNKMI
jgi:hypothetical protein